MSVEKNISKSVWERINNVLLKVINPTEADREDYLTKPSETMDFSDTFKKRFVMAMKLKEF